MKRERVGWLKIPPNFSFARGFSGGAARTEARPSAVCSKETQHWWGWRLKKKKMKIAEGKVELNPQQRGCFLPLFSAVYIRIFTRWKYEHIESLLMILTRGLLLKFVGMDIILVFGVILKCF